MGRRRMLPKLLVYQKIAVVFTLLIVPVYLLSLGINAMGMQFIRNQFASSIVMNSDFYAEQLNGQISFVRNQQLQLFNDSDLQKLGFLGERLSTYDQLELSTKVADRLAVIQNSSDYLSNAGIYVKSVGRVISVRGGVSDINDRDWRALTQLLAEDASRRPIYSAQGRLFFIESTNHGSLVSFLELNADRLRESLAGLVQSGNNTGAVLMDEDYKVYIAANDTLAVFEELILAYGHDKVAGPGTYSEVLDADTKLYRVVVKQVGTLGLTLFTYIDQDDIVGPLRKFTILFLSLSLISIGVVVIFALSIHMLIHRPLQKLIRSFETLETDNLQLTVRPIKDNEFTYLYRSFDNMVNKLNRSIQQNYEQKLALRQSELKQLQSQINPHFLYNGFYNIYRISKSGDNETVSRLAQKLASYYQFITRSGADEVPFYTEYRHAMDYCDIQRIRFANRIEIEADQVPEAYKSVMVPRIVIQPIIENAFEHAFESESGTGTGQVHIRVVVDNERLLIRVEDSGEGLTDEALADLQARLAHASAIPETTGLFNVSRRIRLKYGEEAGLYVSRSELGGLKAEIVVIPNANEEA